MQLVAYGAQDIYLTGNPQITFFKVVYRRHTNFSMEAIEQTIAGSSTGLSGSGTATISRNGDLVHKMYVNASAGTCAKGSAIITEAELEIGGQLIDRHWEEWNNIWNELSTPESKAIGLKAMQCDVGKQGSTGVSTVQVPLNFWFCRNPGLALPLIALQYHEVKVKFNWGGSNITGGVSLFADYIYLDTDERRRFAQVSHEYLIEQIQKVTARGSKSNELNLNHPVKELIWTGSGYGKANLVLNGHDRFDLMPEDYFQLRQPFDYHTAVPKQNLPTSAQISLLDRQTSLDSIHNAGGTGGLITGGAATAGSVYTAVDTADDDSGDFTITDNVLTLGIGAPFVSGTASIGDAEAGTGIPVGTQLAIVCTTSDGAAPTTQGTVGQVYFATVTAAAQADTVAGAGVNAVIIGITTPTATDSTLTLVTTSADSGTPAKFNVFAVTNGNSAQARTSQMTGKINVYSFALKPEEHQPSGTCNFSRIDSAHLKTTGNLTGNVYAVNYNVLRIMSGMGGLAYSN